MFRSGKSIILIMVFCIVFILTLPATVLANSAEPPTLVILVNNPPEDLSIELTSNENMLKPRIQRVAWEGYYAFYSYEIKSADKYTFKVTTNGESFEVKIDEPLEGYNNIYTLNLSKHLITSGEYPLRSALLVSMRVLLTLLIEGIIFWLFGFRQKKSWIVFLIINLITQGALNIWLNNNIPLLAGYRIITLIFGEFFVFLAEMISFPMYIEEHKKSRVLIYAFVANLVSLIAGGYLITLLPI